MNIDVSNKELDEEDDDDEDYDDYDEFLFESIRRYNTLQIFNLENIPYHLLQIDDTSLCVASKRSKGNNSELLKLKLPAKLTLPPEEEGRSKENDFKVLSGIYTENIVYQLEKLGNENKLITSENDVNGLQIYSFTDSALGSNSQERKLNVTPWARPDFSIIQETTQAICSKCCHKPLIQADISVEKKVKEIKHPFYTFNILPQDWPKKIDPCCTNNIKCKPLNIDLIAILNTNSGDVVLHDLRSSDCYISLPGISEKLTKEIWNISDCNCNESFTNYFGILSNRTSFCIYDKRKNSVVIQNTGDSAPKENCTCLKLKFNGQDKFSISGTNSLVKIFKINENKFEHVFTHNGHCPRNLPSTLVTDHIWLHTGGNELVVSVCDNRTLNCWDYKV